MRSRSAATLVAVVAFLLPALAPSLYNLGIIAGALLYLDKTIPMTAGQEGFMVSIYIFGGVIASLFAGTLADLIGRKKMMVTAGVMFVVVELLTRAAYRAAPSGRAHTPTSVRPVGAYSSFTNFENFLLTGMLRSRVAAVSSSGMVQLMIFTVPLFLRMATLAESTALLPSPMMTMLDPINVPSVRLKHSSVEVEEGCFPCPIWTDQSSHCSCLNHERTMV
jgi:MFS family permease